MKIVNQFTSVTVLLLLVFTSDSATQYQQCTEFTSPMNRKTDGERVGVIQLPLSRSRYRGNQICEWNLVTDITGHGIRLDVTECKLQGKDVYKDCNNDYVDIFDYKEGNPMFKGRFCGSDRGKIYLTSGNKMTVRFHSDAMLEFSGFKATYQSVPVDPDTDDDDEEGQNILNKAIGIPVGIIALISVVTFTIVMIKCCLLRKRKASANPPQSTTSTENPAPPGYGLSGGCPSSRTSHSTGVRNISRDSRLGNSGQDPLPSNLPLQVAMPRSVHEGSRGVRSVTPPPAYDTLDFDSSEMEQSGLPLTPPPYESVNKLYSK